MANALTNFFRPGFGIMFDDNEFDRLFRNFFPSSYKKSSGEPSRPNYYTNEDGTELYVELPGCKKEDIEVTANPDNTVVVKAKRDVAGRKDSYRIEFTPEKGTVDPDQMKLSFVDGLLTIPVKEKRKQEARKLTIE